MPIADFLFRIMLTRYNFLAIFVVLALCSLNFVHAAPANGPTSEFKIHNERSIRVPSNLDLSQAKEFIPVEARNFYENLTADDKIVLQNVLSKGSTYDNISEVLTDLRNGSSTLYDKAVNIVTSMRQTVASLSPPARKFVDDSVEQIRNALGETYSIGKIKAEASVIVERYRDLDEKTKDELKNAFPAVATVVYNSFFQTIAVGLLGITTE